MPPRKRAHADVEGGDDGASQATQSKIPALPPVSPDELERLVDSACRYALLREHSRKPLARDQLKEAVLGKERPDRGGKIMKYVIATANQRLLELAGLELVPASSVADADDAGAGGASQPGPSQADGTQEPTQTVRASGASGKLLMVNRLQKALVPAVKKETAVYYGLVEVILTLLIDNGGRMSEADLNESWLPKLGLKEKEIIPGCGNIKVCPRRRGLRYSLGAGGRSARPSLARPFARYLPERRSTHPRRPPSLAGVRPRRQADGERGFPQQVAGRIRRRPPRQPLAQRRGRGQLPARPARGVNRNRLGAPAASHRPTPMPGHVTRRHNRGRTTRVLSYARRQGASSLLFTTPRRSLVVPLTR